MYLTQSAFFTPLTCADDYAHHLSTKVMMTYLQVHKSPRMLPWWKWHWIHYMRYGETVAGWEDLDPDRPVKMEEECVKTLESILWNHWCISLNDKRQVSVMRTDALTLYSFALIDKIMYYITYMLKLWNKIETTLATTLYQEFKWMLQRAKSLIDFHFQKGFMT